jgi:hypothetical protein
MDLRVSLLLGRKDPSQIPFPFLNDDEQLFWLGVLNLLS